MRRLNNKYCGENKKLIIYDISARASASASSYIFNFNLIIISS